MSNGIKRSHANISMRYISRFNWVFLFKAFEVMSITIAISVYHLAPIIVLMIGSIVFKERLQCLLFCPLSFVFIGTVLVAGVDGSLSLEKLMSSGTVWALPCTIFIMLYHFIRKGIQHTSDMADILQTFLGIFLLLPFVDFGKFQGLTEMNWMMITATGLILYGFVYYLFLTV